MANQEILDYIRKSFELKEQGFFKPAIEMLYKALNIEADNIEILEQLAHLYNLLGETDRAIYYIEKVLEINPDHLDALKLRQQIYLNKGELEQANNISNKICAISPDNESIIEKIKVLKKLNYIDEIGKLEPQIQNPDDSVYYELASAYFSAGNMAKARELLEKGHEINSHNIHLSELLAQIYYKENNFEKAKNILEKLVAKSNAPETFNYLGLIEMHEGKNESAVKNFIKAHNLDKQNAEYLYNSASAYFIMGWNDEAATMFKKAICLDPMNADYHYSLAYFYYQQKNYTAAMGEVCATLDINKEYKAAIVLHSMVLAKQGDLINAKKQLDEYKKENLEDDFAYFASYTINSEILNIDVAKEDLKKAIELKPNSISYLSEALSLELKNNNYAEVKIIAEKILDINPNFIHAHIALAQAYCEEKDFSNMFEEAQELINLDSNCPNGYYYNAIALFEQGDKNFAIESLKKSISLDLNNAALYMKMSEFYEEMNDLEASYNWAQEAAEIDEKNYKYRWLCAKLARAMHKDNDALINYSHCYRFASGDKDLCSDYAEFLNSIGRTEQAKRILTPQR